MTTDDGMDVVVTETPSATIARQAAEIERLRLALANAKISFDAIDATLAERDTEIKQLRELLREVIGCGVSYRARDYSEVQIPHVLNDAIREALGEGDE